jgi:hypothetical protein
VSMLCVQLFPTLLQDLTVSSYRGMLEFENSHHNDFLYSLLQVCAVFGNLRPLHLCGVAWMQHVIVVSHGKYRLKKKDGVGSDC